MTDYETLEVWADAKSCWNISRLLKTILLVVNHGMHFWSSVHVSARCKLHQQVYHSYTIPNCQLIPSISNTRLPITG